MAFLISSTMSFVMTAINVGLMKFLCERF
ncbi:DUF2798 domain-containing protein [Bacillus sp. JCM 19041]